jgi:hypothetical protein
MSDTFRVGVTLHSFTNEYCSFKWSFEDMMQKASLLGRGVEIVGPAHHRSFPEVTDEFERVFKSSVERNGLTPTSYGSYADPFMLPGRDLTEDELVAYTIPQLKGAAKLGFPVVRLQYFVHPVIERLLPYAEKYDLKMGYELHTPLMIEAPLTQELIAQVKRISSPHLGLIPDAGIFTRSIPKFRIDGARERCQRPVAEAGGRALGLEDAVAEGARTAKGAGRRRPNLQHDGDFLGLFRPFGPRFPGLDYALYHPHAREVLQHREWRRAGREVRGVCQGSDPGRVPGVDVQRVRGSGHGFLLRS